MDYFSRVTEEEFLQMIEHVEKHVIENDYEKAFALFLLYIGRLDPDDRDSFIIYFKNLARKMSLSNTRRPG
jgi:hypothetical protein